MLWNGVVEGDFYDKIDEVLSSGLFRIDLHKGRVTVPDHMQHRTNWLFFGKGTAGRNCLLWHDVMFKKFGLVPEFCRKKCWKVVYRPRVFRELVSAYRLFNSIPLLTGAMSDFQGKCGLDTRPYTSEPYGVFLYANSLEEAQEIYEATRPLVDAHISPDIPGIVKRSCTEFEQARPLDENASYWDSPLTDAEIALERRLSDIFAIEPDGAVQPDWLAGLIMRRWASYANAIGDKTHLDVFGKDLNQTVHSKNFLETEDTK